MDLRPDPAQRSFRRYLRKAILAPEGPDIAAVVDLGLPVEAGGLDLGEGGLVIAFEELGAALLPNTLVGSLLATDCVLLGGSPAVPSAGSPAAVPTLLADVRAGRLTAGLPDLTDPSGCLAVDGVAWRDPDDEPTHLLVGTGTVIALVPAARVDRPAIDECDVLVPPERMGEVWPVALQRARLRQAAYLTGLARAAWELTAEHVRSRRQFGSALVENQAVAFPLAELAARAQACQLAVHHAAWALDTGRAAADLPIEALCLAAELALDSTRVGMHLHGARGLLLSSPIQRCYRRAATEATRLGPVGPLWRRLGERRLAGLVEVVE